MLTNDIPACFVDRDVLLLYCARAYAREATSCTLLLDSHFAALVYLSMPVATLVR